MKYNIMEKQAYDLVRALKSFRIYLLHSKIVIYVPDTVVKEILMQPDSDGNRGIWIAKILEYDLEIKAHKVSKRTRFSEALDRRKLQSTWNYCCFVQFNL